VHTMYILWCSYILSIFQETTCIYFKVLGFIYSCVSSDPVHSTGLQFLPPSFLIRNFLLCIGCCHNWTFSAFHHCPLGKIMPHHLSGSMPQRY
jgi:hypothetical protein